MKNITGMTLSKAIHSGFWVLVFGFWSLASGFCGPGGATFSQRSLRKSL